MRVTGCSLQGSLVSGLDYRQLCLLVLQPHQPPTEEGPSASPSPLSSGSILEGFPRTAAGGVWLMNSKDTQGLKLFEASDQVRIPDSMPSEGAGG